VIKRQKRVWVGKAQSHDTTTSKPWDGFLLFPLYKDEGM